MNKNTNNNPTCTTSLWFYSPINYLSYLCNRKSFFVFMQKQNKAKNRTSLVSKLLPVERIFPITRLLSIRQTKLCVLQHVRSVLCLCRISRLFLSGSRWAFDWKERADNTTPLLRHISPRSQPPGTARIWPRASRPSGCLFLWTSCRYFRPSFRESMPVHQSRPTLYSNWTTAVSPLFRGVFYGWKRICKWPA